MSTIPFPSVNAVKEIVKTLPRKLGTLENKTIPIQSWGVSASSKALVPRIPTKWAALLFLTATAKDIVG